MSVFKDDQTTYTGNLTVLGSFTSNGSLTIGGDVAITGNTVITGTLTVGGKSIVGASPITNSLGADVLLNNTANYFDGPSVAQGTSGTWFVSGTVTLQDASAAAFLLKLWDGTTVIASTGANAGAGAATSITLSGYLATPAGNLRISCRDISNTTGKILFNVSSNSKDSTISAIRIG